MKAEGKEEKLRIALICPANLIHMPYVQGYARTLTRRRIEHKLINWDRLGIEGANGDTFQDGSKHQRRTYLQYRRYASFVSNRLKELRCDRVIVFGLQLAHFLSKLLEREYPNNYILDVRDHHILSRIFDFSGIVHRSYCTVLSSGAFTQWLPLGGRYTVCHNSRFYSIEDLRSTAARKSAPTSIALSCIGALKDFAISKQVVRTFANRPDFQINFHGEGIINERLAAFATKARARNVFMSGRYTPMDEEELYASATVINMFMSGNSLNNRTCLPNRLYNAVLYGKPLVALRGSYTAEIIESYQLGLLVDSISEAPNLLQKLLFDVGNRQFEEGRTQFAKHVLQENAMFEDMLLKFCST